MRHFLPLALLAAWTDTSAATYSLDYRDTSAPDIPPLCAPRLPTQGRARKLSQRQRRKRARWKGDGR